MSLPSQSPSDYEVASELFRREMDFPEGTCCYVIPQLLPFVPSDYRSVLSDNCEKANKSWITWRAKLSGGGGAAAATVSTTHDLCSRDREVAEAMYKRQLEEIAAKSNQAAEDRALAEAISMME